MANYVRISDTDIYLRVFEQGDIAFNSGSPTGVMTVDFDLDRDFADARAVCGSDTLPSHTAKHYFTFEGQQTQVNMQAVWQYGDYPVIWGMWGAAGEETIYLALLRGGYNPKSSTTLNYYLPLVTCDGATFESTNQTTAYMPVSELTVYDSNPNFAPPHEHFYSSVVTAPTCTTQGYTTYTCECGENYVDNIIEPTGHKYGAWVQTKPPTIFEAGEETHTCASCGISETRSVNKLVLNVEPNSFMSGYRMGKMMLRRLLGNESDTPTAIVGYSYNGTVLPELPEWDKTAYPYASIWNLGIYNYLFISSQPQYIAEASRGDAIHSLVPNIGYCYETDRSDDGWLRLADNTECIQPLSFYDFIWCNAPIEKDGTVVYEKTDPIPVYE